MRILVTGARGFVGKNLTAALQARQDADVLEYNRGTPASLLASYTQSCDFVFHLAGVNRPESPADFMRENVGITEALLLNLRHNANRCPVVFASSTQAALDNPYGQSKKACEDLLLAYGADTGARVLIYRFPNIFGKWCRPDYNSAIATFCHNIARGLPIRIDDRRSVVSAVYIDDVTEELLRALTGETAVQSGFCPVPAAHTKTLGDIADLLYSFHACRETLGVPDQANDFASKLYSTYLSYLPAEALCRPLKMNTDSRGSFTEMIRTEDRGQIAVNVTKPGVTKGNHWHQSKNEKFLVVSGEGCITLRRLDSVDSTAFPVSGNKLELVDIPPGYVHNLKNTGETDLVTVIWANRPYSPEHPDTNPCTV